MLYRGDINYFVLKFFFVKIFCKCDYIEYIYIENINFFRY